MEYANTFSLDFPVELWRPFAQDRPSVRCSSGYLIYLQGTEATCFYYLKKGKGKELHPVGGRGGAHPEPVSAGLHLRGGILFDELPRVSSAVALTPLRDRPHRPGAGHGGIYRNPGMAMAMLKYLAGTVRLLSAHVDDMAFRPAEWRVAQYLLSAASGQDQVSCTQEEIASSISVSRVTVSRILNQFSRRGLVALGYRSISLLDRRTLETLCTP